MPERVVAAIDDAVSLVYLDNPNNPTGQSVPLDAMRMILDKTREVGACVISDEAYGDYLAPEDSAITLVNEYDNLIVMRSFSKGHRPCRYAGGVCGCLAGDHCADR